MGTRAAPDAFGTSLVDLLVGALAIIALLWVIDARNNGGRGEGSVEDVSAIVFVHQIGSAHIRYVTVSQPSVWSCTIAVDSKVMSLDPAPPADSCQSSGIDPGAMWTSDGDTGAMQVTFDNVDALPAASQRVYPRAVRLDAYQIGEEYSAGVRLSIEGVKERALLVTVGIDPCCDLQEPHYVRAKAVAAGPATEKTYFWHNAGMLERVLKMESASPLAWVANFKAGLVGGSTPPLLRTFPMADPADESKMHDQGTSESACVTARSKADTPQLMFEIRPDGDIDINTSPSNETVEQTGESYRAFAAGYAGLLKSYATPETP